jgi:hypothetical protein
MFYTSSHILVFNTIPKEQVIVFFLQSYAPPLLYIFCLTKISKKLPLFINSYLEYLLIYEIAKNFYKTGNFSIHSISRLFCFVNYQIWNAFAGEGDNPESLVCFIISFLFLIFALFPKTSKGEGWILCWLSKTGKYVKHACRFMPPFLYIALIPRNDEPAVCGQVLLSYMPLNIFFFYFRSIQGMTT